MSRYELCFEGSGNAPYFPRYKRVHRSIESAKATAQEVYEKLDHVRGRMDGGTVTASHGGIIYGPGCGDAGIPVRREGEGM